MKKRGQISPIVIGAVIVVFAVISFFVVKTYFLRTDFQVQYEKHLKVPLQMEPVRKYMDECLYEIASEGVDSLGQQGGYIELPYEKLPATQFTPLSSYLEIFPNSGFRTALWFRETPNGIKTTQIPTIDNMQVDLQNYINNNIDRCINNLTVFVNEGYTIQLSESPTSKVSILDNSVDVQLNYPMNIIIKDLKYPLKTHIAQVPVSLGKLYKLAKQVMDAENQQLFLEKQTIDQLVTYEEIPFSGVDVSCAPKIWSKSSAILKIKEVLSKNIPEIRIKGTSYELPNDDFKYFEFDALKQDNPEITANLMYSESWPILIEVTPSTGDIMKSSQISQGSSDPALALVSSIFCLSNYHFVYNIKYPVLISLSDPQGYIFQFATEVIIDRNEPRQNQYEQLELSTQKYSVCDYPSNPITVSTLYPRADGTLISLDSVDVVLKCYPETCSLGTTKLMGNEATLTSTAIPCANAVLEARKEGYYSGKIILDTNEIQENVQPIILEPFYNKQLKIKVIDKSTGEIREPYDSEQIYFQFNHIPTGYASSISIPAEEEQEPVQLLVGDYEITAYVTGTSTWPITYPQQTIKNCVDTKKAGVLGFFKTEEKCFETIIPSTQLDSAIKGGVKFNYTFTREELASELPITVYTLAQAIPGSIEEMSSVYQSIDTNYLDPRFKYPEI